jgi:hypothetical protein
MKETAICRICLTDDLIENLLNLCQCKGTNGYMHELCFSKCITSRRDDKCEICNTKYNIAVKWQTPGFLSAFFSSFKHLTQPLLIRLFIFVLFTTVTVFQIVMIIESSQYRGWPIIAVTCIDCAIALTAVTEVYNLVHKFRISNVEAILLKESISAMDETSDSDN